MALYFNQLPAYLDTFAIGMACAAVHAWLAQKKHGALGRILCSAGSVLMLMLLWQVVRRQAANPNVEMIRLGQMSNRLAMGLLGGGLLLLSANAGLLLRKLFANPVTRFISSVSLQFYIWHQTIAVWLIKYRVIPSEYENPNWEGDAVWQLRYTIACFAVSLIVAAVLTYGFERPVARALQRRYDARKAKARKEE